MKIVYTFLATDLFINFQNTSSDFDVWSLIGTFPPM